MSEEPTLDKIDVAADEDVAAAEMESKEEIIAGNDTKNLDLIIYSADELMRLRQTALSQKWPPYLDEAFKNNRGTWDPDRWHQNKRRGSTPPPSEDGKDGKENKKEDKVKKDEGTESSAAGAANKKKDIKDRLFMTETEGIVLSPQRRSFITGCQVSKDPPKDHTSERNGENNPGLIGKTLESSLRSDSITSNVANASARRVGSGRIRPSTTAAGSDDFDNRGRGPGNYHDSDSRFGSGFQRGGDRVPSDRGGWYDQRGSSNMDRRNVGSSRNHLGMGRKPRQRDIEPEWMSAPVNQDDMMELKGFDDSPEKETRGGFRGGNIEPRKIEKLPTAPAPKEHKENDFNIDDILHMDVIPGLSTILDDNDPLMELESNKTKVESSGNSGGGSRFSQFFSKTKEEQPQKNLEQRRSSITDELKQESNSNSMTSIKIPSPGDPSAYFAPISPAAKTEHHHEPTSNANQLNPIMEMLRSGGKGEQELLGGQKAPPLPQMPDVKTAAELEANIKRMVGLQRDDNPSNNSHRKMSPPLQHQQHSDQAAEMSAFKKFAALVQGGTNGIDENGGHAHKMNPQQQFPPTAAPGGVQQMAMRGPVVRPSPIPANAPTEHDILAEMAMRQQQSEMRMPAPQGIQPSRDDVLLMAAQRRLIPELLKTAEAISLQTAVQNQGMTMLNTILYQFVYGQMEPTRREILLQVIKYYQMKGAFGPQFATPHFLGIPDSISPTSPTPASASVSGPPKASNLAVSPIPGRERIPSPQEIAIHTQQIMQNALIKRKLEEQKENYRRRQEQDQRRGGTDSPSFAFTPTVVMKKMAADRRDSDPKIPELKVSTSSSEQKIMQPPHLMASGQQQQIHQQQQLLFMQQIRAQQLAALQAGQPVDPRILMQAQAMMSAGHPQAHGGQRPLATPPSSSGGPRFMSPSEGASSLPQGGLSRFFSPEVLAQAQSGNAPPLPPLPTQKAMTLEEIERHAAAVRM